MGVDRIDVHTLTDLAYETLERAILNGTLPAGAPLGEAELAGQLGISRGPLREAISRLVGRRLVQRIPHVGVRVVCLSDWDVSEVFAMREVLEGLAARLASQHMSDADLVELEACAEFRHRPIAAGAPRARPADDFHVRVAEGSRNARLIEYLCSDMYSLLRLYRIRSGGTPMRAASSDEHREIVGAMRARDGDAAERLMRAHVARARASLGLQDDVARPDVMPSPRGRLGRHAAE